MVPDNTVKEDQKRDKFFKGQQEKEEFICFFRHHWVDLAKESMFFTVFATVTAIAITEIETIKEILRGNRELKMLFLTGFLVVTVYMHRFFLRILNHFVNVGIITDIRIIDHKKSLYFNDSMDSIDIAQIQNIEKVEEGIFPSLLNFGDIKIFLTASSSTKTFKRIPNARFHFRCLNRQRELIKQTAPTERDHQEIEVMQTQNPVPETHGIDILAHH